jgi:hypothetical protein
MRENRARRSRALPVEEWAIPGAVIFIPGYVCTWGNGLGPFPRKNGFPAREN